MDGPSDIAVCLFGVAAPLTFSSPHTLTWGISYPEAHKTRHQGQQLLPLSGTNAFEKNKEQGYLIINNTFVTSILTIDSQ